MSSQPSFNPSCPEGGNWYACGNGVMFTGCCSSNPCNSNGCPAGNLYPATFDPSQEGEFPDQECSAGAWYTCNATAPPFLGCCKSNPCIQSSGCPASDLAAGYLSSNPAVALAFDPEPPLPSSTSAPPLNVVTVAANSTVTSQSEHPSSLSGGAIGGLVIGTVAAVCLLTGAIVLYTRRKGWRQQRKDHSSSDTMPYWNSTAVWEEKGSQAFAQQDQTSANILITGPRERIHYDNPRVHEADSIEVISEAASREVTPMLRHRFEESSPVPASSSISPLSMPASVPNSPRFSHRQNVGLGLARDAHFELE